MFDDHIPSSTGKPPMNLPIADKAEDMFSSNDTRVDSPVSSSVPTSQPSAMEAGVLKPKTYSSLNEAAAVPASAPSSSDVSRSFSQPAPTSESAPFASLGSSQMSSTSMSATPSSLPTDLYTLKEPKTGRFLFLLFAIIFICGLLFLVAWWVYAYVLSAPEQHDTLPLSDAPIVDSVTPQPVDSDLVPSDITPTVDELDDALLFGQLVDSDGDGLDDQREIGIGTDPDNWDTDADQLSDGDEVIIWKTDPLRPDTDGDGYVDGAEVRSGYSPTGPGKIFNPPSSEGVEGDSTTAIDSEVSSSTVAEDMSEDVVATTTSTSDGTSTTTSSSNSF